MTSPQDSTSEGRLVHLDLKGAPPKLDYYEKIFPLLRRWGTNGLLVEYEDMFPYKGELEVLRAPNSYSSQDIDKFLQLAKGYGFVVIPLIQTFGHFEFVLKHPSFKDLREVPELPMALCPSQQGAVPLVIHMIEQVIELHPDLEWLHIGADEVFHLGVCDECQRRMKENNWTATQLFFSHAEEVLKQIKRKHPHVRLIMWDDMFRETETQLLENSGLGNLVEPMVWFYQKQILLPEGIWDRYSQVFPNIWAASAFKGATGPCVCATDITYHVENHKAWMTVVREQRSKFQCFRGYALTGWQRYDHYSVLCELLPVGLPSLAICLLTLAAGKFTEAVHKQASLDLGFQELVPLDPFDALHNIPQCDFPGSDIYCRVNILLCHVERCRLLLENDRLNGWMTDYHVEHRFANPAHIFHLLPPVQQLRSEMIQLRNEMQVVMGEILYPDSIDEWLKVNIDPRVKVVTEVRDKAVLLMDVGAQPKQIDNRVSESGNC